MKFEALAVAGAFGIEIEPHPDERGFFARLWCRDEFAARGIEVDLVQASVSHNRRAGTLRGMHYSRLPSKEGKLVRCERGRVHDVLVDLRPESPTYLRHTSLELDSARRNAVWIPPGVAHGFQTLRDDSDVVYLMSDFYRPDLAAGIRFDDPKFGLRWPLTVAVIAERDRTWPNYVASRANLG